MKDEKGVALIELALVLPLVLVVILTIFDLCLIVKERQNISFQAREYGNVVYRRCLNEKDQVDTEKCINNVTLELQEHSTNLNTNVLVQVFGVNESSGITYPPTLKGVFYKGDTIKSQYSDVRIQNLKSYNKTLRKNLVTVEVTTVYKSMTPFFNNVNYEAVIF